MSKIDLRHSKKQAVCQVFSPFNSSSFLGHVPYNLWCCWDIRFLSALTRKVIWSRLHQIMVWILALQFLLFWCLFVCFFPSSYSLGFPLPGLSIESLFLFIFSFKFVFNWDLQRTVNEWLILLVLSVLFTLVLDSVCFMLHPHFYILWISVLQNHGCIWEAAGERW